MNSEPKSFKEQRIRKITHLYYSRPGVQKAMFEFAKNREISPRYFEGFGKRPDAFQYLSDIFAMVKKGATSFHCSEELWKDALQIQTGMTEQQLNEKRIGWDLLIDIDCPYFDYSKLAAKAIIQVLENHKIKNIGIKFSGSKGWHILVPWKAFPKQIGGGKTKNLFPKLPRILVDYIRAEARIELEKILPDDFAKQFKNTKIKKGIKCLDCNEIANSSTQLELYCEFCRIGEIKKVQNPDAVFKCPTCKRELAEKNKKTIHECARCNTTSDANKILAGAKKGNFAEAIETDLFDLMGLDLILVSPRHLFRAPYSLHEKTALASVVLENKEIDNFELKDADPMKVEVKNFLPDAKDEEAKELVMQALDWHRANKISRGETDEKLTGKYADYKPIQLDEILDENFPPCVQRILQGIADGKKRAVFVLINLFRSLGMEQEELEKRIYEWNSKNEVPLKEGYIKSQLSWAYRRKPILPQNCKKFYQEMGVCVPDEFCPQIKNPVNYVVRKSLRGKRKKSKSEQ